MTNLWRILYYIFKFVDSVNNFFINFYKTKTEKKIDFFNVYK